MKCTRSILLICVPVDQREGEMDGWDEFGHWIFLFIFIFQVGPMGVDKAVIQAAEIFYGWDEFGHLSFYFSLSGSNWVGIHQDGKVIYGKKLMFYPTMGYEFLFFAKKVEFQVP